MLGLKGERKILKIHILQDAHCHSIYLDVGFTLNTHSTRIHIVILFGCWGLNILQGYVDYTFKDKSKLLSGSAVSVLSLKVYIPHITSQVFRTLTAQDYTLYTNYTLYKHTFVLQQTDTCMS